MAQNGNLSKQSEVGESDKLKVESIFSIIRKNNLLLKLPLMLKLPVGGLTRSLGTACISISLFEILGLAFERRAGHSRRKGPF